MSAHDQGSQSYCGILFNLQGHQRVSSSTRRSKEQVFSLVRRYIDRHLDDPDLGPASLARRHGLSLRSLHALFAERQLTVAGLIRERRLEAC